MLEHDYEPSPGVPEEIPDGERMLWQGPADFKSLLYSTFHVRELGVYFAILVALNMILDLTGGATVTATLASAATFTLLAAVALALLTLYASLIARTTLYTLTNKRLVIRAGIAVPVTVNLPFSRIDGAALRIHADGTGEIAITTERSSRASFVLLWPMVKPFRFIRVQPVLRGIDDAQAVAELLAAQLEQAVADEARQPAGNVEHAPIEPAPEPAKRNLFAYPTAPLTAAAALVVFSLVAVTWGQLTDTEADAPIQTDSALASVNLYFEDGDDGSVIVIDADSGRTLDTLEPTTNGFLRSTMRTFVTARRTVDAGRDEPFVLAQMPNGQLLLTDPATDRQVDLRAFGSTNADAFGRLLHLAQAGPAVRTNQTVSNDVQLTTVALSNQEENP